MKKILKHIMYILGIALLFIVLAIVLFVNFAPQFGSNVTKAQKVEFEKLDHYSNGKFLNYEVIRMDMSFQNIRKMIAQMISPIPNTTPDKNIEVVPFDISQIQQNIDGKARVTWLGHSSFLIEMDSKTILIDPVFSSFASPHKLLGPARFSNKMAFHIEDLKTIDAVIISHDHYDHLDYNTIIKIKDNVKNVYAPLGVGNHFRKWGVDENKIHDLDWWQETTLGDIKIVCTPSRHSSGRGVLDQQSTLWSSWCLLGKEKKLYFSGDGGYGKHFAQIGDKYGPFDFGMIECGQYDTKWKDVHMVPEESVQAGVDVKASTIMPIHWGAFKLANHTWTEPVERFTKKADELNIPYTTPKIGESILVTSSTYGKKHWWE